MNFVFYGLLLVFLGVLFQEILIVDEEMILIISVLIFLGSSYNVVSSFLVSSLNDRVESIKKVFDNYFLLKINTVSSLLNTYQKIYDTNKDLVNVIGVTSIALQDVKSLRNMEIEQFFNFVINNQLNNVLVEEIYLLRTLYYNKTKMFFSNLLRSWKLYEIRGLLSDNVFEEFTNASQVINQNKLALLPLTSMQSNDLNFFSSLHRIKFIFDLLKLENKFLFSYILVSIILGTKFIK